MVIGGALKRVCQKTWDLLSEETTRKATVCGRAFAVSSTVALGSERRGRAFSGKSDLCCPFLDPGLKCLNRIISQRGFKNMTPGEKHKLPSSVKLRLLGGTNFVKYTHKPRGHGPFRTDLDFWPQRI